MPPTEPRKFVVLYDSEGMSTEFEEMYTDMDESDLYENRFELKSGVNRDYSENDFLYQVKVAQRLKQEVEIKEKAFFLKKKELELTLLQLVAMYGERF